MLCLVTFVTLFIKTYNRKFIVFDMFPRYFSLIWKMAVSKILLNEVLYMFYMDSQRTTKVKNDITQERRRETWVR